MSTNILSPSYVETQGDVLKLGTTSDSRLVSKVEHKRGKVTEFSRKSRKRLLDLFARTGDTERPRIFMTLTYPSNEQNSMKAKEDLRAFFMRIRRKFPNASGVWRIEYQERGAIHFHFIFFNLPFWQADDIRRVWGEIIEENNPRIHIDTCRSRRKTTYYVSKYIAKVPDDASVSLSNMPYPHEGRWWGVFNRDAIPMAILRIIEVMEEKKAFWDLKRAIVKLNPTLRRRYGGGIMLFTQNTDEWERYFKMLCVT